MRKSSIILLAVSVLAICLFGCSRTVTEVITYGNEMTVTVTFRGAVDQPNSDYFMILSSQEAFQIPYDPTQPQMEFIEPGIPPTDPAMDYYPYYRTWDGYVILDHSGSGVIWLVKGPFNSSAETYASYFRVQIGTFTGTSNQWSFHFTLSTLYGSAELPSNIYFDIASVGTATNRLQDHLTSGIYIKSYRYSTAIGSDAENSDIPASQDILSYDAQVN
ncbi:MAG: hypothetical protein WC901_07090 [Candidatus Margulisiibacteriota bacterium]